MGFAEGRLGPGFCSGDGPACSIPSSAQEKLQLAQQQLATGIVRRNDDEAEIAGRESGKAGVRSEQPVYPAAGAGDDRRGNAGGPAGLARPDPEGKLIVGISGDFDPVAMEAKVRAAFEGAAAGRSRAAAAR